MSALDEVIEIAGKDNFKMWEAARAELTALRQRVAELEQEKALLFESLGELNGQTVAAEEFGVTKSRQNAALREQVAVARKALVEITNPLHRSEKRMVKIAEGALKELSDSVNKALAATAAAGEGK